LPRAVAKVQLHVRLATVVGGVHRGVLELHVADGHVHAGLGLKAQLAPSANQVRSESGRAGLRVAEGTGERSW
jgi:hypothetical protein